MTKIALLLLALMFLVIGCQTSHLEPSEYSVKDGWQVDDGGLGPSGWTAR